MLGCSLKGERATCSHHKMSLTMVRSSLKSSVKFFGITYSALTFQSHFCRHSCPSLNSIFSSIYGPSTSTLICLYKSNFRSLFDYVAPATCVASPHIQLSWERVQTQLFREHFPFHLSSTLFSSFFFLLSISGIPKTVNIKNTKNC